VSGMLTGKHALVTGGGRGIGAATATALAAEGARLTLLGRDRDVLARHARARHGEVAILVNNAGIAVSVPFPKLDEAAWASVIGVNLTGTYHCTREVVPAMIAAGAGRIVNIASTAGLVGGKYIAAYCAAKHGVVGLTRALATELTPKGITVNAICPGFTESEMLDRALSGIVASTGRTPDAAASALLARNPLGRFVRADEVASAVVWLCRPEADAITGQTIVIDGGEVQH